MGTNSADGGATVVTSVVLGGNQDSYMVGAFAGWPCAPNGGQH